MSSRENRPVFHYTPPTGWLNDPNGLVYYEGEYHLFYQAVPEDRIPLRGRQAWGHAVSTDLVTWEDLPVALEPDARGAIFSGSAVVDWHDTSGFFGGGHGLVAMYTYSRDRVQCQAIAHSTDRGRTWTKYPGNPVIADPGFGDFRDPKVFWHAPTDRWVMILAAHDRALLYTSPNLREWTHASAFGADQGSHAGVWECPDLFALPTMGSNTPPRWVMVVSINGSGGSAMQYFVGSFDGTTFTNANPATTLWADYGRDNYAAVSWSDLPVDDGRRLWIGWMSNWKYARLTPTEGWRGAMTLPRTLALREVGAETRLIQTPAEELRILRREGGYHRSDVPFGPGTHVLEGITGDALEIVATIRPGAATRFGFAARVGAGERTLIGYDVDRGTLFVERDGSGDTALSPDFAGRQEGPLAPHDSAIRLRVFIDRCSVEVFGGDGETVITDLIFPAPASQGLELWAEGGTITATLNVYRLGHG